MINYGLELLSYLGIACIYHFAHLLFEYKFVLLFLKLGASHSLVFYTLSELSIGIGIGTLCQISTS